MPASLAEGLAAQQAQVAQQNQQRAIAQRNAGIAAQAAQVAQQQQQARIAMNNSPGMQAHNLQQMQQQGGLASLAPGFGPPSGSPNDTTSTGTGTSPAPTGPSGPNAPLGPGPAPPPLPIGSDGPKPMNWGAQGFASGSTAGTPQAANPNLGLWSLMPTQEFQNLKASYGGRGSEGWRNFKQSQGAGWNDFKTRQGGFGSAAKWAAPRLP